MGWFGPSKDEVWRRLSHEIGAEYVEGRLWKGNKVQAHVGPWTITLDTHTVSTGHSHVTYTRMRAPYINPEAFRFTIDRKGLFSELGKLLGIQDIEVGDPEFDEAFVIKGNDESKVLARRLDRASPRIQGWLTILMTLAFHEGMVNPNLGVVKRSQTRHRRAHRPAHFATSGVYLSPAAAPGRNAVSSRSNSCGVNSMSTAATFSSR
jgi:hypothetical protein